MHPPISSLLLTANALPTPVGQALLHLARSLRAMTRSGALPLLLDGKHLGLLSADHHHASQNVVAHAARELGARVAWVPPLTVQADDAPQVRDTARLLGRIYDALDCDGLPAELVQCLHRDSGVPVYEGLGRHDHPVRQLLPHLEGEQAQAPGAPASDDDSHHFLLQAMLVHTLL